MKNRDNHKFAALFFLVFLISFTACDSFKKVQQPDKPTTGTGEELDEIQGTKVYNPETGEYEVVTDVTGTLDTVQWQEAPEATTIPPITSEATQSEGGLNFDENTEMLNTYNLVLALPFLAEKYNQIGAKIDRRSIPALNFYEGAKNGF